MSHRTDRPQPPYTCSDRTAGPQPPSACNDQAAHPQLPSTCNDRAAIKNGTIKDIMVIEKDGKKTYVVIVNNHDTESPDQGASSAVTPNNDSAYFSASDGSTSSFDGTCSVAVRNSRINAIRNDPLRDDIKRNLTNICDDDDEAARSVNNDQRHVHRIFDIDADVNSENQHSLCSRTSMHLARRTVNKDVSCPCMCDSHHTMSDKNTSSPALCYPQTEIISDIKLVQSGYADMADMNVQVHSLPGNRIYTGLKQVIGISEQLSARTVAPMPLSEFNSNLSLSHTHFQPLQNAHMVNGTTTNKLTLPVTCSNAPNYQVFSENPHGYKTPTSLQIEKAAAIRSILSPECALTYPNYMYATTNALGNSKLTHRNLAKNSNFQNQQIVRVSNYYNSASSILYNGSHDDGIYCLEPHNSQTGNVVNSSHTSIDATQPSMNLSRSYQSDNFLQSLCTSDQKQSFSVRQSHLQSSLPSPTPKNLESHKLPSTSSHQLGSIRSLTESPFQTASKHATDDCQSSTDLPTAQAHQSLLQTHPIQMNCTSHVLSTMVTDTSGIDILMNYGSSLSHVTGAITMDDSAIDLENSSQSADKPGEPSLNDSLTNIQWLGAVGTSNGQLVKKCASKKLLPTKEEIIKVSNECGIHLRPPYPYMMMIQMALVSRTDKRMTLKEICKWIETTFPYYKQTAKPGWKNSIRHNLSLYTVFERIPAQPKRHGSYWTIREETNVPRYKFARESSAHRAGLNSGQMSTQQPCLITSSSSSNLLPGLPMMQSKPVILSNNASLTGLLANKSAPGKKGPPPILPRPGPSHPLQAYALIPIQSLSTSGVSTTQACLQPITSIPGMGPVAVGVRGMPATQVQIGSVNAGNCQPSLSLVSSQSRRTSHCASTATATVEIRPKPVQPRDQTTTCTIVGSNMQTLSTPSKRSRDKHKNHLTSHAQQNTVTDKEIFIKIETIDSADEKPLDLSIDSSPSNERPSKRHKVKTGLPKPVMYLTKSEREESLRAATAYNREVGCTHNSAPISNSRVSVSTGTPCSSVTGVIVSTGTPCSSVTSIFVARSAHLYSDNDTPPRPALSLLHSPKNNFLTTSTPLKAGIPSPKWLSPIRDLTPLHGAHTGSGNSVENSFLDLLPKDLCTDFGSPGKLVTPGKSVDAWAKLATGTIKTPNGSVLDFGSQNFLTWSPAKLDDIDRIEKDMTSSGLHQNLSRILADLPPDCAMDDDLIEMPLNLSTFCWNSIIDSAHCSGSPLH